MSSLITLSPSLDNGPSVMTTCMKIRCRVVCISVDIKAMQTKRTSVSCSSFLRHSDVNVRILKVLLVDLGAVICGDT
jgi:hypothetical protein